MSKNKIANIISTIGNPLVLSFLVVVFINFTKYDLIEALKLTAILVFIGILPVWLYINKKVKEGKFTDHDVSARTKRPSLYKFALVFLGLMVLVLYLTKQSVEIVLGAFFAWLLAFFSFLINFKLKSSLHTGYAFLIALLTFKVHVLLFSTLLIFAFLVAWSRTQLKRHSIKEVISGATLGFVLGIIYQFYFY